MEALTLTTSTQCADGDLEKGLISPANSNGFSDASTLSVQQAAPKAPTNWPWKSTQDPSRESIIRKLEDKHRGYHSLAVFLDSDENFMMYRRFGYLHSRVLLRMQDKLRKLERELDRYDEDDVKLVKSDTDHNRKVLMSRDSDEAADRNEAPGIRTRTHILDDIEITLEKYDNNVMKAQHMASLQTPADRDYRSVEAYMFDKKPLVDEEAAFIYRREDLVTLRDGRERAFLDAITEKMLQLFHNRWLQYIFCSKADREKTTDPNLHYYSKSRKNYFTTTVLTLVLLGLLILPVFVLYRLTAKHNIDVTYTLSIGVLLVFTLVFSAVLSLFTQAKRHEIFTAAAGYCAVLVVFISNIPGTK